MKTVAKRIIWSIAGLLAIAVLVLQIRPYLTPISGRASFDRAVWMHSNPSDRDSPRINMINDLGRRIVVPGTDKSAVLTELGKPEQVRPPQDFGPGALPSEIKFVWNYPVGSWSGWRVDMDYLAVGFSSKGKVVKHWIWQS